MGRQHVVVSLNSYMGLFYICYFLGVGGGGILSTLVTIRVAKFNLKVGSRRTTNIQNLVVLIIILVVLILLPYYMWVVLVLILQFLLIWER